MVVLAGNQSRGIKIRLEVRGGKQQHDNQETQPGISAAREGPLKTTTNARLKLRTS